jgi:D-galactarolactone cycloisomerase
LVACSVAPIDTAFDHTVEEPARMTDVVTEYRDRGFVAFKIGWAPFGRSENYRLEEAIVRAAGSDVALMVDAGASDARWPHSLKWAIRTSDMLRELISVGSRSRYAPTRSMTSLPSVQPVAYRLQGRNINEAAELFALAHPWRLRHCAIRRDQGRQHQRTKRVAWMADAFEVQYVGHCWNTALGVAADLQLAAALPHVRFVEFIGGSSYVDGILAEPFSLDPEGYLTIPTLLGLGVEQTLTSSLV